MSRTNECEQCNSLTSFERTRRTMPPEGDVCSHCGKWVCPDCIDWSLMAYMNTTNVICKECHTFFPQKRKKC